MKNFLLTQVSSFTVEQLKPSWIKKNDKVWLTTPLNIKAY